MYKITEKIFDTISDKIFTDSTIATLLKKTDNSRYGAIKRAIAKKELIHLRKGLYCLAGRFCAHKFDLFSVSQCVYGPSYVSQESALSYYGWIPESVYTVTCTCLKKAKDFNTPLGLFSYKKVPSLEFFSQVERVQLKNGQCFFIATPLKALVDYVYVYKKNWRGLEPLMNSLRIEENDLKSIQSEELNVLKDNYKSRRVQQFINGLKKDLGYEC